MSRGALRVCDGTEVITEPAACRSAHQPRGVVFLGCRDIIECHHLSSLSVHSQ